MHAHSLGWCGAIRVEQFKVPKSNKHKPVNRKWLLAFIAEADKSGLPHLSALVMFMHQTGTRVGEGVRVVGEDVDLGERRILLGKTKTEEGVFRHITAELSVRLAALGLRGRERVFGYTDPKAVNRRIKAVAKRAKIAILPTHSVGRHSFATNAINRGAKPKSVMDAGGWKSARLFMETYVHSHEAGQEVAALFDAEAGPIVKDMTEPVKRRRATFGKR